MTAESLYGIVAEFDDPGNLVEAARAVRRYGCRHFEAYTPYPVKALDDIVPGIDLVPPMVLSGGLLGAATAWVLQYYIAAIDFPINVGGRPLYSWPSFIPITFELTVLFASCAAFFGTLWLCGLPLLHHPMFELRRFARASNDRFFLCVEARDRHFDRNTLADLLWHFSAIEVVDVQSD